MSNVLSSMRTIRLSVYQAAEWGSRALRVVTVSLAGDGMYAVDWMPVVATRVVGLFTVLTCSDETTHIVFSAFLRLIHSEAHAAEGAA